MKKKILAVFLSLCMAMSLLPVTALATDAADQNAPSTQATTELPKAVNGVITLTGPVDLNNAWKPGEHVILNLNGNTLTLPRLEARNGVTITITDSQNGDGKIVATGPISAVVWSGGTLLLEDGTITSTSENLSNSSNIAIFNMGKFTISGGKVEGGTSGGTGVYNTAWNGQTKITTPIICNVKGGEIEGTYGVCAMGPGVPEGGLSEVNNEQLVINITDGTIITNGQGIATNASSGTRAGFTINMSGGAIVDKDNASTGMYLPAIGVTDITGGTITAAQGIRIGAGELNITGGTITCTVKANGEDLIPGGSGGTTGAIVVGKASAGYVGDIEVNVSGNAVIKNTASRDDGENAVYPTIVVSDKNMANTDSQAIKDPATGKDTGKTFSYSNTKSSVNVSANVEGDIVKISALGSEASGTQDGGNTSLTLTNANITGNVINQTKEGDVGISGSSITGNVTNKSKGEVVIENNSTITGTVSNEGSEGKKGFVAILDSTVTEAIDNAAENNIAIVNSTVNNEPTTNTEGKVAMIGAKTYDTLEKAIEEAQNGDTITLLKDIDKAAGIAVDSGKNFTIDFNGKKYILTDPGAGSNGTETNGFQLLKNSTITFKNGTIQIAEDAKNIQRIIQNYANLTLEDMHIYAKNQVGGEDYALSFNCGSISFKGDTDIITSNKNTIAFDVCYWEAGGYTEGVTVTFDETYTGTINGKIIYDSTNPERAKLTIHGTGYIGAVDTSDSTENVTSITVSGGSFGESVAQYVASDLKYEANANGIYTYHKTLDEALAVSDTVSSVEAAKDNTNAVTVTVKNGNDVDTITLTSGTAYSLLNYPDQGYNHFQGWTDQAGNHYYGGQTVTITADTTFTAVWSYIPPANPNYRIDIPAAEGGTVTANPAAAKAGTEVTLTATPDEGYAVGTITVTDRFGDAVKVTENADGTYTFTMPNGQVTVKATFVETEEPAPAEPFPDVDENDWFYDEVVYVYENGLMNGVENNQFAPNTATNRAMLATILYRLAGQPDVSGDLPFTDVAAGTWYTDAVLWAAQNGVVNGLGENTFAPMNTLTREQLVTMLYRYAEAEGYDVSAAADLSGYPDAGKVQTYAQKAMSWAVAEGIVEGIDGNLNPAGNATRAQIATILMRFCEGVAK